MKLMATVFWDAKGQLVNAVKYSEILDRLNKVVCKKKKKKKDDEYIYISASPCYTVTHSPHMANLTKDCLPCDMVGMFYSIHNIVLIHLLQIIIYLGYTYDRI